MAIQQLLREWPPGYGGVERVAHELGNHWGGSCFQSGCAGSGMFSQDSLPVFIHEAFALDQDLRPPLFAFALSLTDFAFGFL